jgi:hypothetical protein
MFFHRNQTDGLCRNVRPNRVHAKIRTLALAATRPAEEAISSPAAFVPALINNENLLASRP